MTWLVVCQAGKGASFSLSSQVDLLDTVSEITGGLDTQVQGSHYTVGQRRLLCLARAILSQNKILVVEEVAENVDRR